MPPRGKKRRGAPICEVQDGRSRPASPHNLEEPPEDAGRAVAAVGSVDNIPVVGVHWNEQLSAAVAEEGASRGRSSTRSADQTGPSSSASSAPEAARPAEAGDEQWDAAAPEGSDGLPAPFSDQELQQRVRVMLLTAPGKVVASNQRSVAGPPATGLGIDLVAAVATVFKARSKDEKAAMWGKVSQEETIGYVFADLLGYPLIDAGEARTLGDPVRKRSNAAEQQEKADLKAARRRPAGPARDQAVAAASAAVRNAVMENLVPAAACGPRQE